MTALPTVRHRVALSLPPADPSPWVADLAALPYHEPPLPPPTRLEAMFDRALLSAALAAAVGSAALMAWGAAHVIGKALALAACWQAGGNC